MVERDFVEEFIEETEQLVPGYSEMVEAAGRLRGLIEEMADVRRKKGLSQTAVAALMGTSQSAVARLETTEYSPNLSTLERYAWAIGRRIEFNLSPVPVESASSQNGSNPRVSTN